METDTALITASGNVYAQVFCKCLELNRDTLRAQIEASAAMKDFLMEARKTFGITVKTSA